MVRIAFKEKKKKSIRTVLSTCRRNFFCKGKSAR